MLPDEATPSHAPPAIVIADVAKAFAPRRSIRRRSTDAEHVEALDGIDFEVERGTCLGLIGSNGSGKSTLLRLIAGISKPDRGSISTVGRVRAILELGVGFHDDLTGRENLSIAAGLMDIGAERFDSIEEFAGLGDAIEHRVRTYSQGMRARLAFAVAVSDAPDVLLVDEVLSVGDQEFQFRCVDRVIELLAAGTTCVLVSHTLELIGSVCDRAITLERGVVVDDGDPSSVIARYVSDGRWSGATGGVTGAAIAHVVAAAPPELSGNEPLPIDLGFDVLESVELTATIRAESPVSGPGVTLVEQTTDLGWFEPGPARLRATSRPFALTGLLLEMTVELADTATGRVLGSAVCRCRKVGAVVVGTQLTIDPRWEMTRRPALSERRPTHSRLDEDDAVLVVDGATKTFTRTGSKTVAVDDVSFAAPPGQRIGVIGANGAGKSTLLRMIAGVTRADSGRIESRGRVVPLLGTSVGFDPELTGRENLAITMTLLGVDSPEATEQAESLADIGTAIDRRVRTYSSGMLARLSIAAAVSSSPAILLIDELLGVGDERFRRSTIDHVVGLSKGGTTVLFVSHELQLIEDLCTRVIRLDHGRLVDDGLAAAVTGSYASPSIVTGTRDADSPVTVTSVSTPTRHLGVDAPIRLSGRLECRSPARGIEIELSFRAASPAADERITLEDSRRRSQVRSLIPVEPGAFAEIGIWDFDAAITDHHLVGEFDVVISVVTEDSEQLLSEGSSRIVIGGRTAEDGYPMLSIVFEWERG